MRTDTLPSADAPGYGGRPVTKAPNWHALVAWDMLFNNLSAGLFLVSAIGEFAAPSVFRPLVVVGYPVALVFLLADLVCLTVDLGDPWRFHHMLRVFKPSSPMSFGTWCLTAFSLPLAIAAGCALLPNQSNGSEWGRKIAAVLALAPAAGVALYKGVLFSTTAQPGWKDMRWLGAYLASSAILLGAAGLLVISVATGDEAATAILRTALAPLLLLNAAAIAAVAFEARATLADMFARRGRGRIILTAIGGLVVPLGLLLVGGSPPAITAVVLIVAAALVVRFEIIGLPHVVGSPAEPREV
jgi:Ni/Fe-hydrogenase subunit HybB-like protein